MNVNKLLSLYEQGLISPACIESFEKLTGVNPIKNACWYRIWRRLLIGMLLGSIAVCISIVIAMSVSKSFRVEYVGAVMAADLLVVVFSFLMLLDGFGTWKYWKSHMFAELLEEAAKTLEVDVTELASEGIDSKAHTLLVQKARRIAELQAIRNCGNEVTVKILREQLKMLHCPLFTLGFVKKGWEVFFEDVGRIDAKMPLIRRLAPRLLSMKIVSGPVSSWRWMSIARGRLVKGA